MAQAKRLILIGGLLAAIIVGQAGIAVAHPVVLSRALLTITDDGTYRLEITCDLPAYLMQVKPGHMDRELTDEFQSMPIAELQSRLADAAQSLRQRIVLNFGVPEKDSPPDSPSMDIQPGKPTAIALPTADQLHDEFKPDGSQLFTVTAAGKIPTRANYFTITFPEDLESVALIVDRPGVPREQQLLRDGATSDPIPLDGGDSGASDAAPRRAHWLETAWQYLVFGFEHILPEGPDHVLFVLGLFLLSPRLKPLLWQVTSFTVAHSITLILASYEKISLPASVVEPLIAVSISLIALENIVSRELTPWRVLVAFAFGLLHGLGFAGVLQEVRLPEGAFLAALLSFNVGVELGQLAVIALAMLTIGWFRDRPWYRSRVAIPASCVIALVGFYWTIQRIWF